MTQLHVINSLPCTINADYMENSSPMQDVTLDVGSFANLDVSTDKQGSLYIFNNNPFTCGNLSLVNTLDKNPYPINFTEASGKVSAS